MLDYPLCRLFYDLHRNGELSARYRADRLAVIAVYGLSEAIKVALLADDVAALAPHTNGFLLRYYFIAAGVPEPVFLEGLRRIGERAHG